MPALRLHARRFRAFLNRSDGSLSQRALRSGVWVGISSLGINLLTLVRQVVLARLLVPEAFGIMSTCLIVIRGVEIFTQTGFAAALVHRRDRFEDARDTAFTLIVIRGFLLSLTVMLAAPYIAAAYEEEILTDLLRVLALTFVLDSLCNINAVGLQKNLDFKRLAYMEQSVALLGTALIIAAAWWFRSVWALVLGSVFTAFVHLVMSYVFIPGRPRFGLQKKTVKELFGYGKFITGAAILLYLATEIDNALVGKLLGMELLGFYVIAFMLANLPATHISKLASRILFPAYSQLQDNLPLLRLAFVLVLNLVAGIAFPLAAGLMVLAPEFLSVVYGEKWLPAAVPLQILALLGAFRAISSLQGYLLNGIGKPNVGFYVIAVRLLGIVVLIYPMTMRWGLAGTALAVLIPMAVQMLLSLWVISRLIGLRLSLAAGALLGWTSYSVLMGLVVFYAKRFAPSDLSGLLALIALGVALYAALAAPRILGIWRQVKGLMPRRSAE